MRVRGLWSYLGGIVLTAVGAGSSLGQSVIERARSSIVYISFDITDNKTGALSTVQGTGFVVTPNGYVLTASHLFRSWKDQLEKDKSANLIRATLRDKPGYVPESPLVLTVVDIGDPDARDIALLKLPAPTTQSYPSVRICFRESSLANPGDEMMAFGFPENQNFQPVRVTLGTQNAPAGRWAAASAFTYGMSGGPVYNSAGYIIGMVKGGLERTDAVRWITPIEFAKGALYSPFQEQCEQTSGTSSAIKWNYGPAAAPENDATRVTRFTYNTPSTEIDPGLRTFRRDKDGNWTNTYPSGHVESGRVRARVVLDGCNGSVIGRDDEPDFALFIPDKGCPGMMARWRRGEGPWQILGAMQNVK